MTFEKGRKLAPMKKPGDEYTYRELQILHILKHEGTMVPKSDAPKDSIMTVLATRLGVSNNTVAHALQHLEQEDVVLRTYKRGKAEGFTGKGYNPMRKLELVDPTMPLPPLKEMPLRVVVERENRDLERRVEAQTYHEDIDLERALAVLLEENEQQRRNHTQVIKNLAEEGAKVERLVKLVADLEQEREALRLQVTNLIALQQPQPRKKVPSHLTQRLGDAIGAEKLKDLHHN